MLREQIHAPLSLQDGWLGNLQGHHPNLRVWGRSCHLHQAQSSTFVQYFVSGSSPSSRSCKSLRTVEQQTMHLVVMVRVTTSSMHVTVTTTIANVTATTSHEDRNAWHVAGFVVEDLRAVNLA
jgi:hypothetical protein